MQLTHLTPAELSLLYKNQLTRDFPRSERRPLSSMRALIKKGCYPCLAAREQDETVAYALLCTEPESGVSLLDYFATEAHCRGSGVGSRFWQLLTPTLPGPLLLEVESLRSATTPAEYETRRRRIAFYEKNGCADTGIIARVFGVEYSILKSDSHLNDSRAKEHLQAIYALLFPPVVRRLQLKLEP